jgi:RecB family endonuclease NucS
MPVKTEMWRIDKGVEKVAFSALEDEEKLESIIEKDISIVDPDLMILGRQVPTDYGTFVDLLGIDSEGHLAVLELKKNKTPRDVIAQTLDYAS